MSALSKRDIPEGLEEIFKRSLRLNTGTMSQQRSWREAVAETLTLRFWPTRYEVNRRDSGSISPDFQSEKGTDPR
jgi:hypothetical protein